jgi:hypothetical protein
MARIALDLSQFKSAGVYTVEVDQSERIQVTTQTLRLVPGFSSQGPFNAPVFIRSTRDLTRFYGPIDTKLERKGSFFQRSIQTCLLTAPVFAINLLNVNEVSTGPSRYAADSVDYIALSVDTSAYSTLTPVDEKYDMYINFFNRERFWNPDADYLQSVVNNGFSLTTNVSAPLLSMANIGTKQLSFIVRKAIGLQGYGITAVEWYGTEANIPYEWIRPYDLMEDYFIQVIAFEGTWTNYSNLSSDPYYSEYFNTNGLIPSKINDFINADNVGLVGSWVGTIIPDFKDQTGSEQYIETVVNGSVSLTGILLNVNQDALDQLVWDEDTNNQWEIGDGTGSTAANYLVDLVGHNLIEQGTSSADVSTSFLSYSLDVSNCVLHTDISIYLIDTDGSISTTGKVFKLLDASDNSKLSVGTYVKSGATIQPGITRIINKYIHSDGSIFCETPEPISGYSSGDSSLNLSIQKSIEDASINTAYKVIALNGLRITNRHTPGFTTAGSPNVEEGIKKIYGMLHDSGILRGLTNPDMIQYRYIVDTMGYGLQANMGGKSWLSSLAKKRGKCTAILSAPAIKQFSASQNPYFVDTYVSGVDPKPVFNSAFIAQGGNPDMPRSFKFSLPNEELGSKYCGVFGPFLKYSENGKLIDIPPAADVANAYARKFLGGNPYAIVANRNGILSNPALSGVEYMIDKTDRNYLEPFGYNSIIERPATGQTMIYANATAFQNVKSDYNNLHVRELLNTLELQINEVLQNFVFDFNNPITRLNIINSVAPILETVKDAGAIYKYTLQMDDDNNSASIIADGFGLIDIDLWVTGALKKIVARFTVNSEGSVSSGNNATQ